MKAFDDRIVDGYFTLRGAQDVSKEIVIIDIDEKSLHQLGQWPWSRDVLAKITENLTKAKAAIIGWDIVFAERDRTSPRLLLKHLNIDANVQDYDLLFARALASSPSILGYAFDFIYENERFFSIPSIIVEHGRDPDAIAVAKGVILNIDPIHTSAYSSGFFNMIPDGDGVVRSVPMLIRYKGFLYPSLTLEIFRILLQKNKIEVNYGDIGVSSLVIGRQKIWTDSHARILVNFRGKPYISISAVDVFNDSFNQEMIEGKVVFIGTSATGLLDLRATPFESALPGVQIHANVLDNLIKGDYLIRPSWLASAELIAIIFVSLFLLTIFWFLRPLIAVTLSITLVVGIWGVGYYLFTTQRLVTEPIVPMGVALILGFFQTGLALYFENRQKELVKKRFATKVSRSVAEELIKRPNDFLLVQEREVSLFFSDIRNFTDLSEQIGDPVLLAEWLNRYLTPMSEIILKNEGTVDKFIGDAIMAYWNAPLEVKNHVDRALQSALEQLRTLQELNEALRTEGLPIIKIGIGLHTDKVIVGEMGSRLRSDYTAIGEGVNLASRLEGLNRWYGTDIILSQELFECLSGEYFIRYLDRVKVKGMSKSVTIYEASLEAFKDLEMYMKAQELYKKGRFEEAGAVFESLWKDNEDRVARAFMYRCIELKEKGVGFDGVYQFETK